MAPSNSPDQKTTAKDSDSQNKNAELLQNKPGKKGFKRLFHATGYSIKGLKAAWQYEEGIRQEVFALVMAIPLALYFNDSAVERILLIGSVVLVLITELLNSSIEAAVDRISNEMHPLSGRAKDIGSAAVMVALFNAGIIWISLLIYPWLAGLAS